MNEIQKPKEETSLKSLIASDYCKKQIAAALPRHMTPDRMIRVALTTMLRVPKLAACDKASFLNALLTCSQLGLEPDGRRAHLIPFENRKRGTVECQLIIDYKGKAELAMRSGLVSNLHADVVCENDFFEQTNGTVTHKRAKLGQPRGQVVGAFAICVFKDGSSKSEVMDVEEIEAVRNRSRAAQSGPWVTDWNEMAKKTVFHRLSKMLPLSPEYRDVLEKVEAKEHGIELPDVDPIDVASAPAEEPAQVTAQPEPARQTASQEPPKSFEIFTPSQASQDAAKMMDDAHLSAMSQKAWQPKPSTGNAPEMTQAQTALMDCTSSLGVSFDAFRQYAEETGRHGADSWGSFAEIPNAEAVKMASDVKWMANLVKRAKGGK